MTRFDDNLWREVERRYGSELSKADGPLSSGPRWRLPMIAGASLGVAGASAAAVVVLGAASSPPAFAVTTHPDGTVSLVIRRIDGISGANRRLAQLGIHVRAVQVDAQCQALVSPALRRVAVATLKQGRRAGWVGGVAGGVKARIRPAQIAGDRTLVIAAVASKVRSAWFGGERFEGRSPVACRRRRCFVAPARGSGRESSPVRRAGSGKPPVVVSPGTGTTATNETTSTGSATDPTRTAGPPTRSAGPSTTTAPSTPTAPSTTTAPAPARRRTLRPHPRRRVRGRRPIRRPHGSRAAGRDGAADHSGLYPAARRAAHVHDARRG